MPSPLDTTRIEGFVPRELRDADVVVVGCGTTGSWVAHDLLRFGFSRLRICDFDKVEPHNIPMQLHLPTQAGRPKVESFRSAVRKLGLPRPAMTAAESFPPSQHNKRWKKLGDKSYIWSCVDSIEGRRAIAEVACDADVKRLIDLRMGPESGTALFVSADGPMPWESYFASLDATFAPDPACGRRAYVTTAHVLTGLAVHHWIRAESAGILAARTPPEIVTRPIRMRPRVRIDLAGMMIVEEA